MDEWIALILSVLAVALGASHVIASFMCDRLTTRVEELQDENKQLQSTLDMLHKRYKPFEDGYFEGLKYSDIAELAKKSIRLTTENRTLEHRLESIAEAAETYETDKAIEMILKIVKREYKE